MSEKLISRKVIISGMIGNALEWYDFVLYVQFASIISRLFFPGTDHYLQQLATFGVFAAGFMMRPLGGVLFGYIGDKYGRKISVIASILMMAIPTTFIGLLPTYDQIGIAAPILLTIIRLLQGLALGGGFSGFMTFIVEHAPGSKRGIVGSSSMFSLGAGVLLGIGVATTCSTLLENHSFEVWGWRIPFVISIFIGTVAFYIRSHVHESPVYLKARRFGKLSKTPVRDVLMNHPIPLIRAIGLYFTVTVPFYSLVGYFTTYLYKNVGYSLHDALVINGVALAFFIAAMPLSGYLSDRIGRKPVLVFFALAIAFSAYPVFCFMGKTGFFAPLIAQTIFGILLGAYMGPVPATLVELFPTNIRFTGLALSYNISAALFGGTVPFVYTWLTRTTNNYNAPAFYIMLFVGLTLLMIHDYNDKYNVALAEE